MNPELRWAIPMLLVGSLVLRRFAPRERRGLSAVWFFAVACIGFSVGADFAAPAMRAGLEEAAYACAQLAAIHFGAALLFHVLLRRLNLPHILSDLGIGAGYVAVFVRLLTVEGVNVTGLIATSAVLTAVIGLALQDMLGNLAAGIALQLERSIRHGDWIHTEHGTGQVRVLRIRHTSIETTDGDTVVIPNSVLLRTLTTVLGRPPLRFAGPVAHRVKITFPLDYRHSPAKVFEAVEQSLAASPIDGISDTPKPSCVVLDYKDQYVLYGVLVWLTQPGADTKPASDVRTRIYFALSRLGMSMSAVPFSVQMQDTLRNLPAEPGVSLAPISLFQSLTAPERAELESRLRPLRFAPGELIFRQGDPGDSLYVVKHGRVRMFVKGEGGVSSEVGTLGPGDFFGELCLFTGEPRSTTVVAIEEVDCQCLEKGAVRNLLNDRPELAGEIAVVLADRQIAFAATRGSESPRLVTSSASQKLVSRIRGFFGLPS